MADAVQELLEGMVPELHELVTHNLLTKAEVRLVVKKRSDFEYRLRRRTADKQDFVRYVQYELTLEKLLAKRKNRLASEDKEAGNRTKFSSARNIHFIFDRAVKKFKGDVDLWLEWVAYASSQSSHKMLSKIFARALQLHPRNAPLWIHAAVWEFEEQRNVQAARQLLQRALRLNGKSRDLWREYFKMEVLVIDRLFERRRVLGLDAGLAELEGGDKKKKGSLEVPQLDAEGGGGEGGEGEVSVPTKDVGLEALLQGIIPKIVLKHACKELAGDTDFLLSLYDTASAAAEAPLRKTLREAVLQAVDECQPGHSGAAVKRAVEQLAEARAGGESASACVQGAREVFERSVLLCQDLCNKGKVREAECEFFKEVAARARESGEKDLERAAEEGLFACVEAAGREGSGNEGVVREHVEALVRRAGGKEGRGGGRKAGLVKACESAREGTRRFKGSLPLWKLYVGLYAKLCKADTGLRPREVVERMVASLDEALAAVGGALGAGQLWQDRLQLEGGLSGSAEGLVKVFLKAADVTEETSVLPQLVQKLFELMTEKGGVGAVRQAGAMALKKPMRGCARRRLISSLIDVELGDGGDVKEARKLFMMWAEGDWAKQEHDGWIRWIKTEEANGEHKRAQDVYWRAMRTLVDTSSFLQEHSLRTNAQ